MQIFFELLLLKYPRIKIELYLIDSRLSSTCIFHLVAIPILYFLLDKKYMIVPKVVLLP